jgi:hypothetical protein
MRGVEQNNEAFLFIALRAVFPYFCIKISDQGIDIDTVSYGTLLYIFKTGYRAANAVQAVLQKHPYGLGVFLYYRLDGHILRNGHALTSSFVSLA